MYIYIYIYCGKKTMENNFTWYLKFHASRPTIFSQVQRSLKIYSTMVSLIWGHLCRVHFHRFRSLTKITLLWNMLYIFLVCWLLKVVFVFHTCLQQSDLKFVRHGEHLPGFSFCICLFLILLFSNLLLYTNFLRFLFYLNDDIGW